MGNNINWNDFILALENAIDPEQSYDLNLSALNNGYKITGLIEGNISETLIEYIPYGVLDKTFFQEIINSFLA